MKFGKKKKKKNLRKYNQKNFLILKINWTFESVGFCLTLICTINNHIYCKLSITSLFFYRTVQSTLRKVQLTNREDISTSTHNHEGKTNGYIPVRFFSEWNMLTMNLLFSFQGWSKHQNLNQICQNGFVPWMNVDEMRRMEPHKPLFPYHFYVFD
jgi:hypothetical protein